ncbi:MAG: hypothetical protein AAGI01_09275 [Myxococcota bacterium]
MHPSTMNEAFGQLRALLNAPELAPPDDLFALLRHANELDTERYAEGWLPYLMDHDLPLFIARSFEDMDELCQLLPRLERVGFEMNDHAFEDGAIDALVQHVHASRICSLELKRSEISYLGARRLALHGSLSNLEHLDLCGNPIEYTGLTAIAQSPFFSKLHVLRLDRCALIGPGVESLARSPYITQLQELSLADNLDLSTPSLLALLRSPVLSNLRVLHLGRLLSDELRRVIERAPHLTKLESLE